jgi:2-polyprenyl-6-methoxyphenol hydroxylase-like FAD-dependent oxidoreductase
MNTGIQDAVTLADTLQRAVQRADAAALDDYARTRRPIAQRVVKLSDRMTRLATISPRLRPARNLCLQALGSVPAFRRQFALGISELSLR